MRRGRKNTCGSAQDDRRKATEDRKTPAGSQRYEVTNHCFSICNSAKIEIGVSHSKQTIGSRSNRNSFRGGGRRLRSRKMTKSRAKHAALILRIIEDRLRLGPGTGSPRDPNTERPAPGSRCSHRRSRSRRNQQSCCRHCNHQRSRCHLPIRQARIRVGSSPDQVSRSQARRGQASRSRVRRNFQKPRPGRASPGKMKIRRRQRKIHARSRSSIHRREIRGRHQTPDARTARCAIRIVNSRMRIGS